MAVRSVPRLVGGQWRLPEDGRAVEVLDPADSGRRSRSRAPKGCASPPV